MKEQRWYLDNNQILWLSKVSKLIYKGKWDRYSIATHRGIVDIIREGYYGESAQRYLNTIREDYIKDFCTTEEDELPWDIT